MSHETLITIIVINFNGLDDTRECIDSVLKSTYRNFKVIILDNHSTKDEYSQLAHKIKDDRVQVVKSDTNLGFAGGNNKIIREVNTKYVLLLNNDTIVTPGWLEPLINTIESEDKIAAVQPKIKSYYHRDYFEYAGAAGGFIDMLGYPYARGRVGFAIEKDEGQYNKSTEIFWASGSCVVFKTDVIKQVGLLPESFFFYHEETDLCWKLKDNGFKIFYQPNSTIYHKGSGSSKSISAKKIYYVHRNNLLLIFRNMPIKRLILILPVRLLLDILSCAFYIWKWQPQYVISVIRALKHVFFSKLIWKTLINNRKKEKRAYEELRPVSIFFHYFILSKRRYSDIIHEKPQTKFSYYADLLPANKKSEELKKTLKKIVSTKILYICISVIITLIWFYKGKNIAGGEEALLFAAPQRIYHIYASMWYESSTGYPMPVTIVRAPTLWVLGLIAKNVPSFMVQATVYGICVYVGMWGMYVYVKKIGFQKITATIAGLSYFFNIYTMSQVWGRLLFTNTVLWAYLPWFMYAWTKVHEETNIVRNGIIFIVLSFVFSFSFGIPTALIGVWVPAIVYSTIVIVRTQNNKSRLFFRLLVITLLWLIMNSWWLYPMLKLNSSSFASIGNPEENIQSLRGVSIYFPVDQILQLRQSFIFSDSFFSGWYTTSVSKTLTVLGGLVALFGWYSLRRHQHFWYITLLLIVSISIVKGANPPYGNEVYTWLFKNMPQTQILRNPYEKVGVLFTFVYVVLLSNGIYFLVKKFKSNISQKIVLASIGLILFGVLQWPTWRGTLFGSGSINTRVAIPTDYEKVNKSIVTDTIDGRILVMPLLPGDGIRLAWSDGIYTGQEPSEYLFDNPTVARIVRAKIPDSTLSSIRDAYGKDTFLGALQNLNIRSIVLQKKIDPIFSGTESPAETSKVLETYPEILKIQETDNVIEYRVSSTPKNYLITGTGIESNKVKYQKVSSTQYKVAIDNAQAPFELILRNSFAKNWEAHINNELISPHYMALNYANAWSISKKGSYQITIQFKI